MSPPELMGWQILFLFCFNWDYGQEKVADGADWGMEVGEFLSPFSVLLMLLSLAKASVGRLPDFTEPHC